MYSILTSAEALPPPAFQHPLTSTLSLKKQTAHHLFSIIIKINGTLVLQSVTFIQDFRTHYRTFISPIHSKEKGNKRLFLLRAPLPITLKSLTRDPTFTISKLWLATGSSFFSAILYFKHVFGIHHLNYLSRSF